MKTIRHKKKKSVYILTVKKLSEHVYNEIYIN